MLKDKKLKKPYTLGGNCYGYCKIEGFDGPISGIIKDENILKEIDAEDYYFAEVKTSASDSDYHSYCYEYYFNGVFLNFNLNLLDKLKCFKEEQVEQFFPKNELIYLIEDYLKENGLTARYDEHDVDIINNCLKVTIPDKELDNQMLYHCINILEQVQNYYSAKTQYYIRKLEEYLEWKRNHEESAGAMQDNLVVLQFLKEIISKEADNNQEKRYVSCKH